MTDVNTSGRPDVVEWTKKQSVERTERMSCTI